MSNVSGRYSTAYLVENPAVAAALLELGVTEIYAVGGAQAIAALAYGTETIPRVDMITGPGNRYVAAAKKLVFGTVGIDSIAGPSEVVIIADETAGADLIAADLLAQSEHAEDASALLITTSEPLAHAVAVEVQRQTENLPRQAIVAQSLAAYGGILVVDSLSEATAIVNELAPEHLEIITSDDEAVAASVRHAGAIFLARTRQRRSVIILPDQIMCCRRTQSGFSSALGVYDFLKRTSVLRHSRRAARSAERSQC